MNKKNCSHSCTRCSAAVWALRSYYEHQCDEFEFEEDNGELASEIVDIVLATLCRYIMLRKSEVNDIELALKETVVMFNESRPMRNYRRN